VVILGAGFAPLEAKGESLLRGEKSHSKNPGLAACEGPAGFIFTGEFFSWYVKSTSFGFALGACFGDGAPM
jgi:hypothetical protein